MPKLKTQQPSRGQQIVQLAAEGKTDKEIAATLELSPSTVKTYWTRVRQQYGAASRGEAIAKVFREASARHLRLIETMSDGVLIIQDGIVQFANAAMGRILRGNPETLVGQPLKRFVQECQQKEIEPTKATVYRGSTVRMKAKARRCDGEDFDAEIAVAPFEWEGEPASLATVRDRSYEYSAEARIANLLSAIPDLLLVLSPQGLFLDYRESKILLMDESPERLMGRHYRHVFPAEMAGSMTNALAKLDAGESHSNFYFEQSDEGSAVTYVCWLTHMPDGNVLASIRKTAPRN